MESAGEVLDHGHAREPRGRALGIVATAVLAGGLALAAIVAGMTWWSARPPTSERLEIVDATLLAEAPVTVVAQPPVGALATPAGASLPGVTMRLTVGGEPGDSVDVTTSLTDSLVYVKPQPAVTIPSGAYAEIDVTVAPVDCALAREGTDLDEAGYRWRRPFGIEIITTDAGTPVPMSEAAQSSLREALTQACDQAGSPPTLTVTAARRGGEPPLETVGIVVDVEGVSADRLVLTPLDGPGLRGLGAADRRTSAGIPLLWLVSPRAEHNEDVSTAYTQVFVIRGGTAYPWIIGTPLTDDLPEMTPLTTSIR
ncbi:MAG: hypothetical protein RL134_2468 [Actinomycetota bacterium]